MALCLSGTAISEQNENWNSILLPLVSGKNMLQIQGTQSILSKSNEILVCFEFDFVFSGFAFTCTHTVCLLQRF